MEGKVRKVEKGGRQSFVNVVMVGSIEFEVGADSKSERQSECSSVVVAKLRREGQHDDVLY